MSERTHGQTMNKQMDTKQPNKQKQNSLSEFKVSYLFVSMYRLYFVHLFASSFDQLFLRYAEQ